MMSTRENRFLFLVFFASGFCSLLYQVVWIRLAFAAFGVITPVLSVVLSVFMFGLFLGSWLAGKWGMPLARKLGLSAIFLYAIAELVIGIGGLVVPTWFASGEATLLGTGETDSFGYLLSSALIIAGSIFPWCVMMGATFPLMMGYIQEHTQAPKSSFSFLYLANVIGAMTGTAVTALFLVENLGFRQTLWVAVALNFGIALAAIWMGIKRPVLTGTQAAAAPVNTPPTEITPNALSILFMTGFVSMAMEVVWTRAFSPALQTMVYSFASLLFVYLLATWIGSWIYRKHLEAGTVLTTNNLLFKLAVTSLLPIVLNDPRLWLRSWGAWASVFPFCYYLGYLTPKLIDSYSAGNPNKAGLSYAMNVLGCILGPLAAGYLLLPNAGIKDSLLLLAAPFVILALAAQMKGARLVPTGTKARVGLAVLLVLVIFAQTYENRFRDFRGTGEIRRDHTATSIAYGEGMTKRLLVNGIGITHLTPITKYMAHIPLAYLSSPPQSALVICFGMGTTFRSLASWDIDTTGVELIPGVRDLFPYFYSDADKVLAKPNVQIVIDDGRRFLRRTEKQFDVITLDPPPPVEAAGSSLLYSKEFYGVVKQKLKPNGILQQWIPDTDAATLAAVARSIYDSFPYVQAMSSTEGWGHHFLASMQPLPNKTAAELAAALPAGAKADFLEWHPELSAEAVFQKIIDQKIQPEFISPQGPRVTDDRPYNEYYWLRRNLGRG